MRAELPRRPPWVPASSIYYHGVFYTAETKSLIEKNFIKQNPRLARLSRSTNAPLLTFGPPDDADYQKINIRIRDQTVEFMGMKYPITIPRCRIEVDPDSECKLNPHYKKKLIDQVVEIMRGAPLTVAVEQIQDPQHPAYNPRKQPSYRAVAVADMKNYQLIGPPYAGIWRSCELTDALEQETALDDLSNPYLERWAYSYAVSANVTPAMLEGSSRSRRPRSRFVVDGGALLQPVDDTDTESDRSNESDWGTDCLESDVSMDPETRARYINRQEAMKVIRQRLKSMDERPATYKGKTRVKGPPFFKGVRIALKAKEQEEPATWNIEATEVRNEMAMVNDSKDFERYLKYPDGWQHDCNVKAVLVSIYNVRHIFYMTKRPISKGEEILVEYGHAYWERLQMLSTTLAHAREAQKSEELAKAEAMRYKRELDSISVDKDQAERDLNNYRKQMEVLMQRIASQKALVAEKVAHGADAENEVKAARERIRVKEQEVAVAKEQEFKLQRNLEKKMSEQKRLVAEKELLRRRFDQISDLARKGFTQLAKREVQDLVETLADTTTRSSSAICIYSRIAEILGEGATHPVGKDPDNHFESRCSFRHKYDAWVIQCGKCGVRFASGVSAAAQHDEKCELFRLQRAYEEARTAEMYVDESDGLHQLMKASYAAELQDLEARRQLFGRELTNEKMRKFILELADDDQRISSFLSGFLWSIISAVQAKTGGGPRGVYERLADALDCRPDEVPQRVLSVYQLCRCLSNPWMKDLMIQCNTPTEMSWVLKFPPVFITAWDHDPFPNTAEGAADLNDLLSLIYMFRAQIMHYAESGKFRTLDTSKRERAVIISFPPLESWIETFYKNLPMPQGILRRQMLRSYEKQGSSKRPAFDDASEPPAKRYKSDASRSTSDVDTTQYEMPSHGRYTIREPMDMDPPVAPLKQRPYLQPPSGSPVLELFAGKAQRWKEVPGICFATDKGPEPDFGLSLTCIRSPISVFSSVRVLVSSQSLRPATNLSWQQLTAPDEDLKPLSFSEFEGSISLAAVANRITFVPSIQLQFEAHWDIDIFLSVQHPPTSLPPKLPGFRPKRRSSSHGIIIDENPIIVLSDKLPLLSLCHHYDAVTRVYLQSNFYLRVRTGSHGDLMPLAPLEPAVVPFGLNSSPGLLRLQQASRLVLSHGPNEPLQLKDLGNRIVFSLTVSPSDLRFMRPLAIAAIGCRDTCPRPARVERAEEDVGVLIHPSRKIELLRLQLFVH